jgi:hypothetical protein
VLTRARGFLFEDGLAVTYFRVRNCTLSSAQTRFTVLFGMGRRGSRLLWPPDWLWAQPARSTETAAPGHDSEKMKKRIRDALPRRPHAVFGAGSAHGYRVKPHGQLVRVS